jgi:lipoic acid synthetase
MLTPAPWLTKRAPDPSVLAEMKAMLDGLTLHTVCEGANCPNQGDCFSRGTTTFMILGDVCTRNCRFCAVENGHPSPVDTNEPDNLARAVQKLGLKHVVITSVTRDDLPDGGAAHYAGTVAAVRKVTPEATIEVLIPDFEGSADALKVVVDSSPQVINHNMETVPRLYHDVRPKADYHRSLNLIRTVKYRDGGIVTKSGLMLGLGEHDEEVLTVMEHLREADCDILTLGQYLRPSPEHHEVSEYVSPERFEEYENLAGELGFKAVVSGPFVRSSFRAAEVYYQTKG